MKYKIKWNPTPQTDDPHLKLLDFFQLFVANAPMKCFVIRKFCLPPVTALLGHSIQK